MKKYFKFILIVSLVFFIGFTVFAHSAFAVMEGIVPCGPGTSKSKCSICDLFQLIDNIIDFAVKTLVPVLATLMIIVGAFILMTAGGSETQLSKGKDIIRATIVGIVIILISWLIIDTIMVSLTKFGEGGSDNKWGPWNEIKCGQ